MIDNLKEIIGIIVFVLLCVATCFVVVNFEKENDQKFWNGGHCDICGGTWEYEQAVGHRSSTSYIYICNKCGKRIEIHEVR